ncbi:hypothetical protein [Mesorhizobium sp.]|uniref:hypothetical protein n=1 Tax=Mesorhizobium sp. TaxID=1871066 RepID=UPI000FE4D766|nr:hypothetical protein [Mesorhizobium sp.]RWM31656.1 MAG: hypothetical protein EOR74_00445 [Mesorhizobium sp.]
MTFNDIKWSPSEKKVARSAFDVALQAALAEIMAELKRRASAATTPSDMWEIEDYLQRQRRKIDQMFDYRYSQLILVFASLIREGYLEQSRLAGLSEDKLEMIRSFLAYHARA